MAIIEVKSSEEFKHQAKCFRIKTFQSYNAVQNGKESWSCISHNELRMLRYLLIKACENNKFEISKYNISGIIDLWITFITHINRTENAKEFGSCFLTREQLYDYGFTKNVLTKYVKVLSDLGYLNVIKRHNKVNLYFPLIKRDASVFLPDLSYETVNDYFFNDK